MSACFAMCCQSCQLVSERLTAGDEPAAQEVLEALIDLAKIAPGFLKPQMENVAQVWVGVLDQSSSVVLVARVVACCRTDRQWPTLQALVHWTRIREN
jgi:hypothetical protein